MFVYVYRYYYTCVCVYGEVGVLIFNIFVCVYLSICWFVCVGVGVVNIKVFS